MAGKGSKPRSCFSAVYKNNYDEISWNKQPLVLSIFRITYTDKGKKKYRVVEAKDKADAVELLSQNEPEIRSKIVIIELLDEVQPSLKSVADARFSHK